MEYAGFSLCEGASGHAHLEALNHLLEFVDVADHGGMDAWFFPEHHCNPQYSLIPSPNLITAVASERTRRIRLGSMVTVVPFHHPLRAAEEIRLLDALTGGRLEVGLGRGGIRYETGAFGMGHTDSEEVFTVGTELLLRFLTEGTVDYDTPFWTGTGAVVVPEATQRPHPPIWLAAGSDRTFAKAAQLGAHCMTGLSYGELLGHQIALYRDAWAQHQNRNRKPPGRFGLLVFTVVAESTRDAERHGKDAVQGKVDEFLYRFSQVRPGTEQQASTVTRLRLFEHLSKLSFRQLIEEGVILFGSVDDCVEQVAVLRSSGLDMLTTWVQFAGLDYEFARRSLRLFCDEVIPRVERPIDVSVQPTHSVS